MSNKEDHLAGITPIVIRRAAYYLSLGEGEYFPEHPHYDKVTVERTYDITQNPLDELEWSMGMIVNFHKDGRRVRWIEFGCRLIGAGGDPIVQEV